jgi:hypothetical protein
MKIKNRKNKLNRAKKNPNKINRMYFKAKSNSRSKNLNNYKANSLFINKKWTKQALKMTNQNSKTSRKPQKRKRKIQIY